MPEPTLFSDLAPELEPPRHCTLDGREYRAQVVEAHGKVRLLVEYRSPEGWREVRFLIRRADVAHVTGLGRWNDERRRIVMEDGREEGEVAHPDAGGKTGDFQKVQQAKAVLQRHHGRPR